jgi:drug/metabolite transporter (DMT)-like permease
VQSEPRQNGLPYAAGAILLWSTSAVVVLSISGWAAPPLLLGTHTAAAIFLNGGAALKLGPRQALAELGRLDLRIWCLGFLGIFVYQIGYVGGLQTAPPAEANLLNYLWPLCTALFAIPVRGEKLKLSLWVALFCGLAGLAVLVGGPVAGDYPLRLVGYALCFGAAVSWGLYSNLLAGV